MPSASYVDYAALLLAMPGTAEQLAQRMGWRVIATRLILRRMQALQLAHASRAPGVSSTRTPWLWQRGEGDSGRAALRPKPSHIGFAYLWREIEAGATVSGAAEAAGASRVTVLRLLWALRARGAVQAADRLRTVWLEAA